MSVPTPKQTAAISAVTAGPAAATRNSTPAESVSLDSLATPPNSHRSMPSILIPLRIATTAWPSSCRTMLPKKSSAETTASTNELVL
jgi:hypothetical protein